MSVDVAVNAVHFRSDSSILSQTVTQSALDDLTSDGPVKLVANQGTIRITDGEDRDGRGVVSLNDSDVLLMARGTDGAIRLDAAVFSAGGNIGVIGEREVLVLASVQTSGLGTIESVSNKASIEVSAGIESEQGDILLQAESLIAVNATVQSRTGNVGILSAANIDLNTTLAVQGNNVLLKGTDLVMQSASRIEADDSVVVAMQGTIHLAQVIADRVGLVAGIDIIDANGDVLNVQADSLSLHAGGLIGAPSLASNERDNPNAIDTSVNQFAAAAGGSIYIQERNAITIGDVAIPMARVTIQHVHFRSDFNTIEVVESVDPIRGIRSGNAIKLVSDQGTIQINEDVLAGVLGNVLLDARGVNSDLAINASIVSLGGHITFMAGRDITVYGSITTSGIGTVLLETTTGSISIADVIQADSDIALRSSGELFLNATVQTQDSLSVQAVGDIHQSSSLRSALGSIGIQAGGSFTMSSEASVEAFADVIVTATQTIELGRLEGDRVAVETGVDILDANGAQRNVVARQLSLRAGQFIGTPSLTSPIDQNSEALDVTVGTLATLSGAGTYVEAFGDMVIGHVDAIALTTAVERVNFRSDQSSVTQRDSVAELSDATSRSHVKLVTHGTITVTDGTDGDGVGIESTSAGNILVEARGASADVIVMAGVRSVGGSITLLGADSVDVAGEVSTSSDGSIAVLASAGSLQTRSAISSERGDIRLSATGAIRIDASVLSESGNLGIDTTQSLIQNALLRTTHGDILVLTGSHWTMQSGAQVEAQETLIGIVGDTLTVTHVSANRVAIVAGGSIVQGQPLALNAANIEADQVSLQALSGSIGSSDIGNTIGPDSNTQAIRLDAARLAANGATGIYIESVNDLSIDVVQPMSVTVTPQIVRFRSDTAPASLHREVIGAGEDLTSFGPIKLVSHGNLVVGAGLDPSGAGVRSLGSSDILLETRNSDDLWLQGDVTSAGGHISIRAGDDLIVQAKVETQINGTMSLIAENRDVTDTSGILMQPASQLRTAGGNISLRSFGEIHVSAIQAGAGTVTLSAAGSIVDANPGLNISARGLIAISSNGAVGQATDGLETEIDVFAAHAATGIFVTEQDGIVIDRVESSGIERVAFESSRSRDMILALEDLTTDQGDIRLTNLNGDLWVDYGVSDIVAIDAINGNVHLESQGTRGDLLLGGSVRGSGSVTLIAQQGAIDEFRSLAKVTGQSLSLQAGAYAHLHQTQVQSLSAHVVANGLLDEAWQSVHGAASDRGDDFLTVPSHRSENDLESFLEQHETPTVGSPIDTREFRFAEKYAGQYALYLKNEGSLTVVDAIAGTSAAPNIYIESMGDAADLTVQHRAMTASSLVVLDTRTGIMDLVEGGLVLVAGRHFVLEPSATLETQMNLQNEIFVQQINSIGSEIRVTDGQPDTRYLNGLFFDAGQGIEVDSPTMTSTRTVVPLYPQTNGLDVDYETHVFQRVVIQFGSPREAGFVAFVGYADRTYQVFDVASEIGSRIPFVGVQPIPSYPTTNNALAATLVRSTEFDTIFLSNNQYLPTDAIVRRAPDFFLFENASAIDPMAIRDLTFEGAPILDVITRGDLGGAPLPADLAPIQPPEAVPFALPLPIEVPNLQKEYSIEISPILEPTRSVSVYRVIYNDVDMDGQPDALELPSPDEVLNQIEDPDILAKTPLGQRFEKLKDIPKTVDGSSPTPTDVEAFKAKLRDDPEVPAGAYAIIETVGDSQKEVLEVFEVRDFEETKPDNDQELPLVPSDAPATESKPKLQQDRSNDNAAIPSSPSNNAKSISGDDPSSRLSSYDTEFDSNEMEHWAAMGVLFSSLWAVRQSAKSTPSSIASQLANLEAKVDSRERRRRTVKSACRDFIERMQGPCMMSRIDKESGETS
jgi:hypothetical protein